MPIAAVAAVAQVGSSLIQSNSAKSAAKSQANAAAASDATQRYFYDTSRTDNLPFLQTGYKANDQLNALMSGGGITKLPQFSDYTRDPSYAWQQSEAAKAVQGSAAARGGLYSGAALRALGDRAQGIAASDFGNWWNRQEQGKTNSVNLLNAIRSGGQAAAGQVGAAGQNAANAISGNALALGNAQGAASIAQGNIWGNAINRLSSYGSGGNMFMGASSGIPNDPYQRMGYA